VARDLLGRVLVSAVGDARVVGIVVETEAYGGSDDPASHAATRNGSTRRNRTMWSRGGTAYVYRSYGAHWCLNVVTGPQGLPAAVLLRGLEVVDGEPVALRRREGRRPLTSGPGRLAQALGITSALDGHDLEGPPLMLCEGIAVPDSAVLVSGRIGVSKAVERPWRFFVRGSPGVTPGKATGVPFDAVPAL